MRAFAGVFDERFAAALSPPADVPPRLVEAMRYSALAPGKRLRPFLVARCCELAGGGLDDAWAPAMAVECIHAFSLIHDDLPAMDDDDLRRGKPTCHKVFGEAVAILAGDALVARAFELIAYAPEMVGDLARGTGWSGMIGGQTADVLGEGEPPKRELVEYIHARKTAALFETACRLGTIAGGGGSETVERLGRFGQSLGQAFQIADDLLDLTATPETLGKGVRKDAVASKQTYPGCVGIDESRRVAERAVVEAVERLSPHGKEADDLRGLARYVVDRNY